MLYHGYLSGLWRLSWVSEIASFVSTNPTAGLDGVLACRWFFHGHNFMHFLVDVRRAKQAELLACLYGAKVAWESVVVPLVVESEGLAVVSKVNSVMRVSELVPLCLEGCNNFINV